MYWWSLRRIKTSAISELSQALFQGEAKCKATDVTVIFYSRANKTHFHKKGLHLMRIFVTQRWPINLEFTSYLTQIIFNCRNGK